MKVVRIILAPFYFLLVFFALLIIPLGPMALLMGLGMALVNVLLERKDENEWDMTFMWFVLPYYECKKFIKNEDD